jgi:hypothetical protein
MKNKKNTTKTIKIFLSSIVQKECSSPNDKLKTKNLHQKRFPKSCLLLLSKHEETKTYPHQNGVDIPLRKNISSEK